MSFVFALLFGAASVFGYTQSWPLWGVIVLGILSVVCLIYFLAKHKVFGEAAAEAIEVTTDSNDIGDIFDLFDD